MALGSLQELARDLVSLRLLTIDQLDEALADVGRGSAKDLLEHLERKGLLTLFQIQKLENGDKTGYLLGRFKLLYLVSAGSFARVYRGVDSLTGEVVAIKVLRGRHTSDAENIRQFQREGRLTESFDHPNITRTYEVGTDREANQHYIAMEFVEGGNFREFLKIRGKLDPAEVVRLGREMVDGLRYALSRGITHRDIKPTNILVSAQGHVKWVDFGLGGGADRDPGGEGPSPSPGAAGAAPAPRTVDYAGLEKATGAPKGDPRSDIFFLGTVLYQMLTGRPAMPETKDKNARMRRSRFDQIRPLRDEAGVPPELAAIIDKMIALRPTERYQTLDEVMADLDRLAGPSTSTTGAARAEASAASHDRPRVVIIHRSPKVQGIIKERLAKKGYQVVLTSDVTRALSLHKLRPVQCVIMDLETTGREGIDALRGLLRGRSAARLAAIFLAEKAQLDWTAEFPADQVVTLEKPVTLGPVYNAVRKLVPRPRDVETDGQE